MSLFFVISTMLEFAGVLFLKRILEWKTNTPDTEVMRFMRVMEIADIVALVTFLSLYGLFNFTYWTDNLRTGQM